MQMPTILTIDSKYKSKHFDVSTSLVGGKEKPLKSRHMRKMSKSIESIITLIDILEVLKLCYWWLQTEMMSDSIDDALDNDDAEEETEELTNQVCLLPPISFASCFFQLQYTNT
jgi:hypothetical protein